MSRPTFLDKLILRAMGLEKPSRRSTLCWMSGRVETWKFRELSEIDADILRRQVGLRVAGMRWPKHVYYPIDAELYLRNLNL